MTNDNKRSAAATIALGSVLFVAMLQSFGMLVGGSPSLSAPVPMPVVLLYFAIGPVSLAIPIIAFWLWAMPLFWGSTDFPVRSVALIVLAGIASIGWYSIGEWKRYYFGVELPLASGAIFISTLSIGLWCRRRPAYWKNAVAHWLLFAWLGSYAFPWLGEVP